MSRAQLILDLPHRPALGAEDFLVSDCNLQAVRTIDAWPDWSPRVRLLIGPRASGKTHLVRVWQARSGALDLSSEQEPGSKGAIRLVEGAPEAACFVLENADKGEWAEKTLFHLLNLITERRLFLLLSAERPPARWGLALPDLLSRLNGLAVMEIGSPDDELLKTVMLKQFADRQLDIDPKVLDFLALRIDRSLQAASEAVAAVDRAALATGRKISRQLVSEAIRGSSTPDAE